MTYKVAEVPNFSYTETVLRHARKPACNLDIIEQKES
jgi:hypothetical protein